FIRLPGFLAIVLMLSLSSISAANPFKGGWVLENDSSSLTFQTIKNGSKLETSGFASYQGEVDESGAASLRIQLDSVDTKVDLRNVRMRFLFFETFKYPEATVVAAIDPATISTLWEKKRLQVPVNFDLNLHGVTQPLQGQAIVTVLADNQVSVASVSPITIPTNLFDLDAGVQKLQEAANVTIVPMGSVSYNLVFNTGVSHSQSAPEQIPVPATAQSTALESQGEFSDTECVGRFEILSRTGSILFKSGSAELDSESDLILAAVADIVKRCPELKIIVAGHTDAAGSDEVNQWLSEQRARSVANYLVGAEVDADRVVSVGYGETRPVAPNDTAANRSKNRRIEFLVDKS
ncbi:MAG: OmpA family protein, partial [Pseudomonadota bacterium]